jgi:hypothetical protein
MHRLHRPFLVVLAAAAAAAAALVVRTPSATGFTQEGISFGFGSLIPVGHEWLTRLAALELLGKDPVLPPDPKDPRKSWTYGKAKNLDVSSPGARAEIQRILGKPTDENTFASAYTPVLDAILGERWVDIAGFNITNSMLGQHNCFDAVAQEPVDIQYDHFMRRYDDGDVEGGMRAVALSRERFRKHFVAAATAPPGIITAWNGGGSAAKVITDRNYFLFGRAVHLFEDSFSSEHTVRGSDKNFEQVVAVKSYLCASGSEQHSHSNLDVLDYTSGDVIWLPGTRLQPGFANYKPSAMKVQALVATEATKDLWAAFIRTMGTPMATRAKVADQEATRLIDNWLSIDPRFTTWYDEPAHRDATYVLATRQGGKGRSVATCMKDDLKVASGKQIDKVKELQEEQRICIYNMQPILGFSDAVDPSLRIPYHWEWKGGGWAMPPSDWKVPETPVPPEVKLRIKSSSNGKYLTASDGLDHNQWIYAKDGPPIDWIQVGTKDKAFYRAAATPLFLSYNNTTRAVKLWQTAENAQFRRQQNLVSESLLNTYWDQYMWLSGESPYITGTGNPANRNSWWIFEPVPPAK